MRQLKQHRQGRPTDQMKVDVLVLRHVQQSVLGRTAHRVEFSQLGAKASLITSSIRIWPGIPSAKFSS
jgi:hypothetical protein